VVHLHLYSNYFTSNGFWVIGIYGRYQQFISNIIAPNLKGEEIPGIHNELTCDTTGLPLNECETAPNLHNHSKVFNNENYSLK
jgi:hypothetical protein